MDSHLQFDCHAKEVARARNYHTRALRHVRTLLTDDLAQTLACSIVASRLDYCNATFYDYVAPAATFDVLQRTQNNLARVVCQRGGRTDDRPLLRSLHWLPMKHRVIYKMVTLTFKTMSSSTPAYLSDLIQMAVPVRPLRSSDAPLLSQERKASSLAGHFRSFTLSLQLCISFTVSEIGILSLIWQNLKRSHDSEHIPFQSDIPCMHSYSCVSISTRNFKCLASRIAKIR